jgi:predicted enzyme related to lactoylglutathione lyase
LLNRKEIYHDSTSRINEEPHTVFKNGEAWAGGMMKMHWEAIPSWLGCISVENVDTTTAKAVEMGCHVCAGPMDIPGIGRFSVITDPVGATVAMFTHQ